MRDSVARDKRDIENWVGNSIDEFQRRIDQFESQIESAWVFNKKKRLDEGKQDRFDELKNSLDGHKLYMSKLKTLKGMVDGLDEDINTVYGSTKFPSQIKRLKDDIGKYLELSREPRIDENELQYVVKEVFRPLAIQQSGVVAPSWKITCPQTSILGKRNSSSSTCTTTEMDYRSLLDKYKQLETENRQLKSLLDSKCKEIDLLKIEIQTKVDSQCSTPFQDVNQTKDDIINLQSDVMSIDEYSGFYQPAPYEIIKVDGNDTTYRADVGDGMEINFSINLVDRILKSDVSLELYDDRYIDFSKTKSKEPVVAPNHTFGWWDSGNGTHYGSTQYNDPLTAVKRLICCLKTHKQTRKQKSSPKMQGQTSANARKENKRTQKSGCGSFRYRHIELNLDIRVDSAQNIIPCEDEDTFESINRILRFFISDKNKMSIFYFNYIRHVSQRAIKFMVLLCELTGFPLKVPLDCLKIKTIGDLTPGFFLEQIDNDEKRIKELESSIPYSVSLGNYTQLVLTTKDLLALATSPVVDIISCETTEMDEFREAILERQDRLNMNIQNVQAAIKVTSPKISELLKGRMTERDFKKFKSRILQWLLHTEDLERVKGKRDGRLGKQSTTAHNTVYVCDISNCKFTPTKIRDDLSVICLMIIRVQFTHVLFVIKHLLYYENLKLTIKFVVESLIDMITEIRRNWYRIKIYFIVSFFVLILKTYC